MLQYYAPMLHFKLKYKKLSRSIYNVQNQLSLFLHNNPTLKCYETGAWKLEYTRLCHHENFRLTRLAHIQGVQLLSESRIIVETGVTVEVSARLSLCSGPLTNLRL